MQVLDANGREVYNSVSLGAKGGRTVVRCNDGAPLVRWLAKQVEGISGEVTIHCLRFDLGDPRLNGPASDSLMRVLVLNLESRGWHLAALVIENGAAIITITRQDAAEITSTGDEEEGTEAASSFLVLQYGYEKRLYEQEGCDTWLRR